MARDIRVGWDVESLNKAYRQGCMAARVGMPRERCPYRGQVFIAAWDAGWEDAACRESADDTGNAPDHASVGLDDFFSRIA